MQSTDRPQIARPLAFERFSKTLALSPRRRKTFTGLFAVELSIIRGGTDIKKSTPSRKTSNVSLTAMHASEWLVVWQVKNTG